MDWYCLGHAMWLVEAEGLRILFDPLLEPTHHGGVFEVHPRRTVHAEALRADFVLVSHRHGDHFDVPSLRRLAALDPDSVVLTPDELVAWAARRVGFRTVHLVPPAQRVDLDAVRLVTTPSYGDLLEQIAAVSPATAVPSSCGARHVGPSEWLNRHVYPVDEARFLEDLAGLAPSIAALPSRVGGRYGIDAGAVELESDGGRELVTCAEGAVLRPYDPLAVPPLQDPEKGRAPLETMRARVERWVRDELGPALQRAWPSMQTRRPIRFVVDVVWPATRDAYTLHVAQDVLRIARELDSRWDLLDRVAGSLLFEVIEGRYSWGDVLLGGMLRAVSRAYEVSDGGLRGANVASTFLYYALPYDESVRRSVVWQVEHG